MSAVRYPFILKTSTFSTRSAKNTFYMSATMLKTARLRYKDSNLFQKVQKLKLFLK